MFFEGTAPGMLLPGKSTGEIMRVDDTDTFHREQVISRTISGYYSTRAVLPGSCQSFPALKLPLHTGKRPVLLFRAHFRVLEPGETFAQHFRTFPTVLQTPIGDTAVIDRAYGNTGKCSPERPSFRFFAPGTFLSQVVAVAA